MPKGRRARTDSFPQSRTAWFACAITLPLAFFGGGSVVLQPGDQEGRFILHVSWLLNPSNSSRSRTTASLAPWLSPSIQLVSTPSLRLMVACIVCSSAVCPAKDLERLPAALGQEEQLKRSARPRRLQRSAERSFCIPNLCDLSHLRRPGCRLRERVLDSGKKALRRVRSFLFATLVAPPNDGGRAGELAPRCASTEGFEPGGSGKTSPAR